MGFLYFVLVGSSSFWLIGVVSKQLSLYCCLIGDSTAVVDSLTHPMRYLNKDAVASCGEEFVWYFGLIRNEF